MAPGHGGWWARNPGKSSFLPYGWAIIWPAGRLILTDCGFEFVRGARPAKNPCGKDTDMPRLIPDPNNLMK
jgi:hypothetical protein